ncbi:DUF692 domain-containing protein [Corallococcus sp. EGB]|uniref:DUF692 domain-containing protein n=1 Tax=Corallococcus sp. EGB TaxID=1521117 RepID=UPI001CBE89B3|nr:DUF692 domain-containing protein [Corallococcus sp. EGB]
MGLPSLGVGLGCRWDLEQHLASGNPGVDWLEVTPEHFLPLTPDSERRLELHAKPLQGLPA